MSSKLSGFTIDDEVVGEEPGLVKRAKEKLVLMEDGKLVSTRMLCSILSCGGSTFGRLSPLSILEPYRVKVDRRYLWGNPETIKLAKEKLNAA